MAFYGYPDILDREKDRKRGEMRVFIDALRYISYSPPEIDEDQLSVILSNYDRSDELKDYILRGQQLVLDTIIEKARY